MTNPRKIDKITACIDTGLLGCENAKALFFNRFEEFIFDEYPEIKNIRNVLESFGCAGLMSGSGATVFGLLAGQENLIEITKELAKKNWNVWTVSSYKNSNDFVF